jgi:hypothetical protein
MTSDTRVTAYEVNWKAAARALAQDNKRLRAALTEIATLPDASAIAKEALSREAAPPSSAKPPPVRAGAFQGRYPTENT